MSHVYSMEPRTGGKVNINTTHGQLSVELWNKECPLACKNFVQLCLEGYYDQSPFHRLVPGFCLQGGRSVDGDEGEAVFDGGRFAIETHSRLKFSRRGLLGMVALDTSNQPNGSQFFFTLSESPELNGKSTLFGRLAGDTIFNLLRMGELETDLKTEAPLYPPKIINTEVVVNPFEDIVIREKKKKVVVRETEAVAKDTSSFKKKNVSLLSFVDEEDGEDVMPTVKRNAKNEVKIDIDLDRTKPQQPAPVTATPAAPSSLQFLQQMKSVQMRETQDKIKKMEEELGFRPTEKPDKPVEKIVEKKNLSALEAYKAKFAEKKKRKPDVIESNDEMGTLLLLNSFRQKIQKSEEPEAQHSTANKKHLDICKLHGLLNCLSCRDTFNINLNAKDDDQDEKDWMMHKLVFNRRELEGRVRDDLRDLVVIDPREQAEKANKQNK